MTPPRHTDLDRETAPTREWAHPAPCAPFCSFRSAVIAVAFMAASAVTATAGYLWIRVDANRERAVTAEVTVARIETKLAAIEASQSRIETMLAAAHRPGAATP